ncbi:uncharacterized protein PHACADRAFT_154750, partial [Phanerochaete carnosa HHB-10118-sp]
MLAHNPLKRRAEEPLLPLYAPKRPRRSPPPPPKSLSTRWIEVGEKAMDLFHDTGLFLYYTVTDFVFGYERVEPTQPHVQSQRQLKSQASGHHPSYPISPPSSSPPSPLKKTICLKSAMKPSSSDDIVYEPRSFLPSPPLSSTSSSETSAFSNLNEAGLSSKRTVRFKSPPPPPRPQSVCEDESDLRQPLCPTNNTISDRPPLPTPPPSNASGSSPSPPTTFLGLYPKIDQALTAAIHRQTKAKAKVPRKIKHREHIFHSQFKANVKDQLRKTREDMERELYLLRKRTSGFRSSMREFRGWLGYRERLELLQKLEDMRRAYFKE